MFNFSSLWQDILKNDLEPWLKSLPICLDNWQKQNSSSIKEKQKLLNIIPAFNAKANWQNVSVNTDLNQGQLKAVEFTLKQLKPWKKGPFQIDNLLIDAEWRSDLKWQRLQGKISPLQGKKVLDIGTNNGYHLWRMLGDGADLAIGVEPSLACFWQFQAIKKLFNQENKIHILPLKLEALSPIAKFDAVFSMGVLYHCKSPLEHLENLKAFLNSAGELILETLIIEGDANTVLTPSTTYAKMNNVYFIPSIEALKIWLKKVGFKTINLIDISTTSANEQRSTSWCSEKSLSDFLNPTNSSLTIENYPAPKRAVLIAKI